MKRKCLATVAALTFVVGSCSDDSDRSTATSAGAAVTVAETTAVTTSSASVAETTAVIVTASTTTTATTTTSTIAAPLGDPSVQLTPAGRFQKPVGMSWRPSDGLVYVVEQDGTVATLKDGQRGAVALDMTDLTSADGERGLLGLAVNAEGTLAYVDYTDNDGNTRVDEYAVTTDGTFDESTRRNVLGIDQPYPNHNGGGIVFGPDRMLYIGTGDGGSANDPDRNALNTGSLLGKMLRIDPRATADAAYTIPPGNPFAAGDGARPEIWSVGLRNPWRFSFDRATGDLWIADVGQNQWEEIDVAWAADGRGAGANFGWSAFEGNHRFNEDQSPEGATPPIYEYSHDAGCSVSGGVLYRGAAIPELVGWYVYSDYCSGEVRALQIENRAVSKELTLGKAANLTAVTERPDGELYVLSLDGPVYAVTRA